GTLYVFLPTVSGKTGVPVDSGGTPINFDVVEHFKFAFMGTLDAHNGRWGAFTDLIYINLGSDKHHTRDFTIGDIGLPGGTTPALGGDLKGTAWTVAGQYRLVSEPKLTLDALGGARWLDMKNKFTWNITGDIGPIDPLRRSGRRQTDTSMLDGIVGVKGRLGLGDAGGPWSIPFY